MQCCIQRGQTRRISRQSIFTERVQRVFSKGRLDVRIGQQGEAMEERSGAKGCKAKGEEILCSL
jgi:hypothetical protein